MPDLQPYIELIKQGEVVAFPTETVYGLGADVRNASAIQKVFALKGRPADNPLIVHVSSVEEIIEFSDHVSENAHKLVHAFWPGPLTLVLEKKQTVLDSVTAGLNSVALRMPAHPLALEFISKTGALVAPSANKSGRPSPTKADHVKSDFGSQFPVIDGGSTVVGLESTVLDLSTNKPVILRPGKIGMQEIEEVIGVKVAQYKSDVKDTPKSPGQKYSHYKPSAAVQYGTFASFSSIESDCLYLLQSNIGSAANIIQYNGDLELLSHDLYDRFRQADIEGYTSIFLEEIEPYRDQFPSLYIALKNRIDKALS